MPTSRHPEGCHLLKSNRGENVPAPSTPPGFSLRHGIPPGKARTGMGEKSLHVRSAVPLGNRVDQPVHRLSWITRQKPVQRGWQDACRRLGSCRQPSSLIVPSPGIRTYRRETSYTLIQARKSVFRRRRRAFPREPPLRAQETPLTDDAKCTSRTCRWRRVLSSVSSPASIARSVP